MSPRWLVGVVLLVSATPVYAQPGKLVRVTYSVTDLVTLVPGRDDSIQQDELIKSLRDVIVNTVAPKSWEDAGGKGAFQYFPLGNALVIQQTLEVHAEIARLLAQLRRVAEMQVAVETRLLHVSPTMARLLKLEMDERGEQARTLATRDELPTHAVTMEARQIAAVMKRVQLEDTAIVKTLPKITLFNAQRGSVEDRSRDGDRYEVKVTPVIEWSQSVRMTFNVQYWNEKDLKTGAVRTFVIPQNRSLVWRVGESTHGHQIFAMATPRVLANEEDKLFQLTGRSGGEEQAIPATRLADAKERAIKYRLRQPISLNFKDVPLDEAIKELATISGIQIVPDMRTFKEARIDLKYPITGNIDNVDMNYALRILLAPLRLRHVIENQVLKITTEVSEVRLHKVTYPVGDLIEPENVIGEIIGKSCEKELMGIIVNTIARESWEKMGGKATIQYFPSGKAIVISQTQENHEELQLLLATLRKLQDLAVTLDVRFVAAPNEAAQQMRKRMAELGENLESLRFEDRNQPGQFVGRFGSHIVPDAAGQKVAVSMEEQQMQWLVASMKSSNSILQTPRMKVYNGQQIPMECTNKQHSTAEFRTPDNMQDVTRADGEKGAKQIVKQLSEHELTTGWRCQIQPIVSPDRRFVRLSVNVEHKAAQHVLKSATMVNVADGRTMVWDLGTNGDEHLFVMVTPRVVVREEQEGLFMGTVAPIPGR